ncbi:MAG: hypothetical protein K2N05_11555 [Muribaculaceae bacterium]|nr:hypothetical protein [Muribaculaceae bacterium]
MEKILKALLLMVVIMASSLNLHADYQQERERKYREIENALSAIAWGRNLSSYTKLERPVNEEYKRLGEKEYEAALADMEKNKIKNACKKLEKAVSYGHSKAASDYVNLLTDGKYLPADTVKAIQICKRAAKNGDVTDAIRYGSIIYGMQNDKDDHKYITKDNYYSALEYLIPYSAKEDGIATFLLASLSWHNEFMNIYKQDSLKLFEQAYNQGYKSAAGTLAYLYSYEGNSEHSIEWAKKYLQENPEDAEKIYDLISLTYLREINSSYCSDTLVADLNEYLKTIFRNGNRNGLLTLLKMGDEYGVLPALDHINFDTFTEVDLQNDPELVEIFQKLKNENSPKIAVMYRVGIGTEKNLSKALEVYKNIQNESAVTTYRIGELYEQGADGGVPNIEKAKSNYYTAGNRGYSPGTRKNYELIAAEPKNANDNIYAPKCYWKNGNLVNEQGKTIMRSGQYKIQSFESSVIIVKKGQKVGALNYNGNLVVPVAYDKFEGSGAEGRMLFSNKVANGVTLTIFTKSGKVVAKQTFSNSSSYSVATFIKNNMNFLIEPYR